MSDTAFFYHVTAFLYRPLVRGTIRVLFWAALTLAVMIGPYIIGQLLGGTLE